MIVRRRVYHIITLNGSFIKNVNVDLQSDFKDSNKIIFDQSRVKRNRETLKKKTNSTQALRGLLLELMH